MFRNISDVLLQTRVTNFLLQHDKWKTRKIPRLSSGTTVLQYRRSARSDKSCKLQDAVFRWDFLRQQDATARIYHHAGPSPGLLRRENGGSTLPACSLRRSVLGCRHLGCSRWVMQRDCAVKLHDLGGELSFNLLKPTWYTDRFNIQQLYALPTLYLCVLYLSENKQRLVPLTA